MVIIHTNAGTNECSHVVHAGLPAPTFGVIMTYSTLYARHVRYIAIAQILGNYVLYLHSGLPTPTFGVIMTYSNPLCISGQVHCNCANAGNYVQCVGESEEFAGGCVLTFPHALYIGILITSSR